MWIVQVMRYRDWLLARAVWSAVSAVVIGAVIAAASAFSDGRLMDPLWVLPVMVVGASLIWALITYRSDRGGERRALEAPQPLDAGADVVSPWPRTLDLTRRRLPWALLMIVVGIAVDLLFDGDSVAWIPASIGFGEAITDGLWLRRRVERVERDQGRVLFIVAGTGTIAWAPGAASASVPSTA